MYSDRSFSQNAATVMMIVSGLLMIPAIFGLFFAAFVFVGSLVTMSMPGILFGATPFLLFGAGTTLLIGYKKHNDGTLEPHRVRWLWIASAIFNFLPLIPMFMAFETTKMSSDQIPMVPLFIWWPVAFLISVGALIDRHFAGKYR